jgi:hypothetical protein
LLEEEIILLNEELEKVKKQDKHQTKDLKPPRFKITWSNKSFSSDLTNSLLEHLFSKYGEIEVCLLNAKKTSAIVEYKKNQDALKVFKDEETLRSKYSIVLTWLGSDISKEKKENQETLNDSSPNNQNLSNPDEFTDLSFEEMEAAILKKLKRN